MFMGYSTKNTFNTQKFLTLPMYVGDDQELGFMIFQEEKQKEAGHKMHTGIINLLGMTNLLDHKIVQI